MVLMVFVVPSVYDTNKYTRRTTSIPLLTTGGLASSPYALLPTPHQTLEGFCVGLAQFPSSCFTKHFGKVCPSPWGQSLSREALWVFPYGWAFREHLGGKALGWVIPKGKSPLGLRIQLLVSTLWKCCHLWEGGSSYSAASSPVMLSGLWALDVLPPFPIEHMYEALVP